MLVFAFFPQKSVIFLSVYKKKYSTKKKQKQGKLCRLFYVVSMFFYMTANTGQYSHKRLKDLRAETGPRKECKKAICQIRTTKIPMLKIRKNQVKYLEKITRKEIVENIIRTDVGIMGPVSK